MTNLKLNKTSVIEFSFELEEELLQECRQHYLNMVFIKKKVISMYQIHKKLGLYQWAHWLLITIQKFVSESSSYAIIVKKPRGLLLLLNKNQLLSYLS